MSTESTVRIDLTFLMKMYGLAGLRASERQESYVPQRSPGDHAGREYLLGDQEGRYSPPSSL